LAFRCKNNMKKLLLVISFLFCGLANAADPAAVCASTRTSGAAPLGIVFDGTGSSGPTNPFHNLLFTWNFGDTGAGDFSYGAKTASKNGATGAVAGHVYETPGTYTARLRVSNGTLSNTCTITITVTNPDTVFASTATVCFYNTTVGTGCPSGATQTQSSDFDAAISSCMGATKRCLFKRGDTFASSTTANITSAGPNYVGAYGSGAKPVITSTNVAGVVSVTNAAVNDLRIADLDIRGSGSSDTGKCASYGASASNITMLRVECSGIGGLTLSAGSSPANWAICTGCILQDSVSPSGLYFVGFSSALIGNSFGPARASDEHSTRIQRCQKCAISNNTMNETTDSTKHSLTLRADPQTTTTEDTFYTIVSNNRIIGSTGQVLPVTVSPSADSEDARMYDVIIEGNWLTSSYSGAGSLALMNVKSGTRMTVRNNLFDLGTGGTGTKDALWIIKPHDAVYPVPTDVVVNNNTMYSGGGAIQMTGITFDAENVTATAKNNLCYFPTATGTVRCLLDQATGTTASGNSSDAETTGTSPAFDGPLTEPKGFRISKSSYAATGGTATFPASNDDFFNCDDVTANEHIGAMVPRARATCRGVKP